MGGHPGHAATDRGEDDARLDGSVRGLDARHPAAVTVAHEAGDGRVLVDLHTSLRGARGERPGDPVVPRGRALEVMRGTQDRVAAAAGQVDLGDQLLELGRGDHHGLRAAGRVHLCPRALGPHRHLGVGDPEDALGLMEDLGAGLLLEALVELERVLVEPDRLGDAVVGADDRRVAAGVARGDVVGFEDGDVRDAVAGGEVVRGRRPCPPPPTMTTSYDFLRRTVRPADRSRACRCRRSSEAARELVGVGGGGDQERVAVVGQPHAGRDLRDGALGEGRALDRERPLDV